MKLSIVTPVYHEEENILRAIDGIRKAVKTPYELLVVYDTPDDPTYTVVKEYASKHGLKQVRLVRNCVGNKRGFLNALRSGFVTARGDAVITMMADLCDDPRDIDAMYRLFIEGADVVCASRYMKGGRQIGSPLLKRTLSRWAGVSLYYLRRLPIHDATNNFKLYSRNVLRDIELSGEGGFEIALQLTVKAHKRHYTLRELPTTWRDRDAGEAKFNLRKMLPRYLKWYIYALSPENKTDLINEK
jgi:glycosyltransferase involved in cell wall biosynthesis